MALTRSRQTSQGCCARSMLWVGRTGDGYLERTGPIHRLSSIGSAAGTSTKLADCCRIFSRCSERGGAMKCFSIPGLENRLSPTDAGLDSKQKSALPSQTSVRRYYVNKGPALPICLNLRYPPAGWLY